MKQTLRAWLAKLQRVAKEIDDNLQKSVFVPINLTVKLLL